MARGTDIHILAKFNPEILLSSNFRFKGVLSKKLDLTIGINNILDSKLPYIQPYLGEHSPLPSLSRALTIKLLYHI